MRQLHREDIKAAIRKKAGSLYAFSESLGYGKHTIAYSLSNPLPRANRAVSKLLGIPLHQLWPEWYDEQGWRITSSKNSAKRPAPHSKKSAPRLTKNGGAA